MSRGLRVRTDGRKSVKVKAFYCSLCSTLQRDILSAAETQKAHLPSCPYRGTELHQTVTLTWDGGIGAELICNCGAKTDVEIRFGDSLMCGTCHFVWRLPTAIEVEPATEQEAVAHHAKWGVET